MRKCIRSPLTKESLGTFNPAPLTLTDGEGRLLVPASLYEEHQLMDATRADVEAFLAEHYEKFLHPDSKFSLSVIERALQGEVSSTTAASAEPLPEAPHDASDPVDAKGVELLANRKEAVSACGKFRIHVTADSRLYVTVQTDTVVNAGARVAGFGSGGLRPQKEVEDLVSTKGAFVVKPRLQADTDHVILAAAAGGKETYATFYTALTESLANGSLRWPVDVPFHTVNRTPPRSSTERERYTITATGEKVWVAIPKQARDIVEPQPETKSAINWSNILRFLSNADGLNNQLVKIVWLVRPHELGLLKLERPLLVWSRAHELKAGAVLRLA